MTRKYAFRIVATADFRDHSSHIKVGDVLYESDNEEVHKNKYTAGVAADNTVAGLSGSRAYDAALRTADIEIYERG